MSPRKLTAADKKAIVSTYRSSLESTTALADRYGVSNSTISRLLKNNIPEDEYESLISEKRSQRGDIEDDALLDLLIDTNDQIVSEEIVNEETGEDSQSEIPKLRIANGNRRVRRRSSASEDEESPEQHTKLSTAKPITRAQKYSITTLTPEAIDQSSDDDEQLELDQYNEPLPMAQIVAAPVLNKVPDSSTAAFVPEEDLQQDLSMVASIFGEEMADMSDLLDEDDEDLPDEEGWSEQALPALIVPEMQVLPLASATLPRTCYIVVDKFAELVACPLRDFVELGKVSGDAPQNTLPVFDSQRVAKRFSNSRNQRVIKVPDSGVFYKTIDHLLAKGISLMLVDGHIYSLR